MLRIRWPKKGDEPDGNLSPLAGIGDGPSAYEQAHAGLPLVQHSLLLMLHYVRQGKISLEKMVEKMSHAVATCFQIAEGVISGKVILPTWSWLTSNRPSV